MKLAGRVLAALLLGAVAALVVLLGYLAFLAHVENVFLHSWEELTGWRSVPSLVVPALLVWAAVRLEGSPFWRALGFLVLTLASGAAVGVGTGATVSPHPSGPWAGGLMGAGAGGLLGSLVVAVRAWRRPDGNARFLGSPFAVALLLLASACRPSAETAPGETRLDPLPDSSLVESVVFLLGDPGMARMETHPVLPRLQRDVEAWSRRLGGEGEVRVVVLGDILYPAGLNPPSHPSRESDSLRLTSQIATVGGAYADTSGARAFFLPGNHDWGQQEDVAGARRLERLADFLEAWDGPARGRVELHPEPGKGGPVVVDLGDHLRLILLDTAWWLLGRDPGETGEVLAGMRSALETAGDRHVVVAAHHPLQTGGPHGIGVDLGSFLGVRALLKNAGILLQDLDSRPYSALRTGLLRIFDDVGRPDLFVGGHEHSLQVFDAGVSGAERALVLGSASKLTGVAAAPGMLFGRSEPGYGKLIALRDGRLHIEIEAAPSEFLSCPEAGESECLQEGVAAFRTVWSETVGAEEAGPDPMPPGADTVGEPREGGADGADGA